MGKKANEGNVHKPVTAVDNWSLIHLGDSEKQCRTMGYPNKEEGSRGVYLLAPQLTSVEGSLRGIHSPAFHLEMSG